MPGPIRANSSAHQLCALRDIHNLNRRVLGKTLFSELNTDARTLDATKRYVWRDRTMLIHPCSATLQARCNGAGFSGVRGPHGTTESDFKSIGLRDGIVKILVFYNGQQWSELFLVDNTRAAG